MCDTANSQHKNTHEVPAPSLRAIEQASEPLKAVEPIPRSEPLNVPTIVGPAPPLATASGGISGAALVPNPEPISGRVQEAEAVDGVDPTMEPPQDGQPVPTKKKVAMTKEQKAVQVRKRLINLL